MVEPESYATSLLDRIADEVAVLWSGFQPTAAELYAEFFSICGDDEIALEEALAVTDQATADLACRLGVAP